jgi:hypothetical protein
LAPALKRDHVQAARVVLSTPMLLEASSLLDVKLLALLLLDAERICDSFAHVWMALEQSICAPKKKAILPVSSNNGATSSISKPRIIKEAQDAAREDKLAYEYQIPEWLSVLLVIE